MQITNANNIPLAFAMWLLHDTYDTVEGVDNYISMTSLMRPIRQLLLSQRIPLEERTMDLSDYVAAKMGNAFHDSIEQAWTQGNLSLLEKVPGLNGVAKRILVNPSPEELKNAPEAIPVYLENRYIRKHTYNGITYAIGGKYDMVVAGEVQDTKSTSVWEWIKENNQSKYQLQMSGYRWIDAGQNHETGPQITSDIGKVNFIFTDFSKAQAKTTPGYPPARLMQRPVPLLTFEQFENWLNSKFAAIEKYKKLPQSELPECTDEELWRSPATYKYYKDAAKASVPGARSTKNFDTLAEANLFMSQNGNVGTVKTVPGEVKACAYCPAFQICTQKDQYL